MAEEKKILDSIRIWVKYTTTISDFLDSFNRENRLDKFGGAFESVDDFLNYKDPSQNKTNRDIIYSTYNRADRINYYDKQKNNPTVVKAGTGVVFPLTQMLMEKQLLYNDSQFLHQSDFVAYFTDYQKILQSSDNYVKASYIDFSVDHTDDAGQVTYGAKADVQLSSMNVRVWIYSKILDKLIDVSAIVSNCNTAKSFNQGTFNIQLAPARSVDYNNDGNELAETNNVQIFNLFENGHNRLTHDFCEDFLQYNDVVFIRFERLLIERDTTKYAVGQTVDTSQLANPNLSADGENSWYRVWDMIGLIDSINVTTNFMSSDKTINIVGRDLNKLFTDDGAYFYAYKYVAGSDNKLFYMGDQDNKAFKRLYLTGTYEKYFLDRELKFVNTYIGFVINQLSNIGLVPDSLFSSYGDRISKKTVIPNTSSSSSEGNTNPRMVEADSEPCNGIWQIVKVFTDDATNQRVFAADLGGAQGNMMNFITTACQQPFVEYIGDTWVDTFNLIARQPPFTRSAILSVVSDVHNYITVFNRDLIQVSLEYDNTAYSWFQLVPRYLSTSSEKTTASLLPVIYLPMMANVFGMKRLIVDDPYIFANYLTGSNEAVSTSKLFDAAINDLCYILETNIYLPFTRRGQIVMNGDRRIKVGTFIRLEATNELFYVAQVNNNLNLSNTVDRTTVLTVERGMYWPLITGSISDSRKNNTQKNPRNVYEAKQMGADPSSHTLDQVNVRPSGPTYFDIANVESIKANLIANYRHEESSYDSGGMEVKFGVNQEIFDIFMKRRYLPNHVDNER